MFCLAGNDTQVQHRVYTETPDGSLFLHSFYPVNITFKEMVSCEESKEAVLIAFPFFPHYKAASDSDVAFQMINDDVAETLKQLAGEVSGSWTACVRASRSTCASTTTSRTRRTSLTESSTIFTSPFSRTRVSSRRGGVGVSVCCDD